MKSVKLVGRQVRQAVRLACERVKGKRNYEVADPDSYSGPSITERDFTGVLAELAVASYYGLTVDTDASGPDSGYDFVVQLNGQRATIDVKGYTHLRPRLLVTEGSVTADHYIHTRVNMDEYWVDCRELEYQTPPNKIVTERLSDEDDEIDLRNKSLDDVVFVDLLGWANKQQVVSSKIMTHKSDPSHTVPRADLDPIPDPSSVQSFGTGSWFDRN